MLTTPNKSNEINVHLSDDLMIWESHRQDGLPVGKVHQEVSPFGSLSLCRPCIGSEWLSMLRLRWLRRRVRHRFETRTAECDRFAAAGPAPGRPEPEGVRVVAVELGRVGQHRARERVDYGVWRHF